MNLSKMILGLPVAYLCLVSIAAHADIVSLTGAENSRNIAEIDVEDDRVRVVLEIHAGDLDTFRDVLSDEWYSNGGPDLDEERRRKRFAEEVLQVLGDGSRLPLDVEIVEPRLRIERYSPMAGQTNPWTGLPIPGPPDDKRVVYCELNYRFPAGNRPDSLTIIPPLGDHGFATVEFGFLFRHRGVMIVDFSALSQSEVLHLDWADPWYTRFANKQLKRWQESGIMTFLYIEPHEVRHEMLVRVKDVSDLTDLGLRNPDWIEEDEFRSVEQALGSFLADHSLLQIDGSRREGILERVNFVRYDRRQTRFLTQPERLSTHTAMFGAVITYFTEGIPKQVDLDWNLFTPRIQRVPATATDPAGPFPTYLTPDYPRHTWENFLKTYRIPTVDAVVVDRGQIPRQIPALSLLLLLCLIPVAGLWRSGRRDWLPPILGVVILVAAVSTASVAKVDLPVREDSLDPEEGHVLMEVMLRNVYRALDFRDEEDVYDKLAVTVAGDLLTDVYLQHRRSFILRQAGGAQAKVESVNIEDARPVRRGTGYQLDLTWTATGSVGHWGHEHSRTNRYNALVMIEPHDGVWKITGMQIREEERLDPGGTSSSSS